MNFLALCQDLANESGAVGAPPLTVTGQTGRQARVVAWIGKAWRAVQNLSPDWSFLQGEWQGTLTQGANTYTGASFNIDRFAEFSGDRPMRGGLLHRTTTAYSVAEGQAGEKALHEMSYERWREKYGRGTHTASRPLEYCIAPDGAIRFGPTPDAAYVVRGEYRKTAQVLVSNSDVPDLPERFHDVIVWQALKMMAEHDEAPNARALTDPKYLALVEQMYRDLLPKISAFGGSPIA